MLHPNHTAWLEARGISGDLAKRFGLDTVVQSFPNPDPQASQQWLKRKAISLPYIEYGKTINHKYRAIGTPEKREKLHVMDKGAPLTFFNHDVLIDFPSHQPLVICEGEWDMLIADSVGWKACSVPNGAPPGPTADVANAKRYEFMWRAQPLLEKIETFILATDDDGPGIALRNDLVQLLGYDRCKFIDYRFPAKDLNEVLLEHGAEEVAKCLHTARPYPVKGLYSFSDFPDVPAVTGTSVGIDAIEDFIKIVPGTFTLLTGYSNMGKSTVMDTILAHQIANDIVCCVASPETPTKPVLQEAVARALIGCSQSEYDGHFKKSWALDLVETNLKVISNALDEALQFDLEAFLDLCMVAYKRFGVRLFVLDPWNELEHKRLNGESLTEYVGRAIRLIKGFAKKTGSSFWVIAHPSKPHPNRGVAAAPTLYDVSDSANWANKPDYGLVYHRGDKDKNEASLTVVKVRKGLPGKYGHAKVFFDHKLGRIRGVEQTGDDDE